MFQGVERPCELIFSIRGIEKSYLDEAALEMFEVGEWLLETSQKPTFVMLIK
jgi:hypothetical protein